MGAGPSSTAEPEKCKCPPLPVCPPVKECPVCPPPKQCPPPKECPPCPSPNEGAAPVDVPRGAEHDTNAASQALVNGYRLILLRMHMLNPTGRIFGSSTELNRETISKVTAKFGGEGTMDPAVRPMTENASRDYDAWLRDLARDTAPSAEAFAPGSAWQADMVVLVVFLCALYIGMRGAGLRA